MLLITSLQPRRDGTVVAVANNGKARFTFKARPEDGQLVCEVDDDETVAALLKTENFYPANDADFETALALAGTVGGGDDDGGDGVGDDLEDGADDEGDPNGAPVEVPAANAEVARTTRSATRSSRGARG
jgi:hypothetical protein